MRITAGILTILGGFIGGSFWQEFVGILSLIPGFLAVIGGYYILKGQRWNRALVGAICSIIVPFFGIPAVILLIMRRGEFA